jgi:hypothetical protein
MATASGLAVPVGSGVVGTAQRAERVSRRASCTKARPIVYQWKPIRSCRLCPGRAPGAPRARRSDRQPTGANSSETACRSGRSRIVAVGPSESSHARGPVETSASGTCSILPVQPTPRTTASPCSRRTAVPVLRAAPRVPESGTRLARSTQAPRLAATRCLGRGLLRPPRRSGEAGGWLSRAIARSQGAGARTPWWP